MQSYQLDSDDIVLDPENANLGTERGDELLSVSLERFGAGRSVLLDKLNRVIAGNKTVQKAIEQGIPIEVIETDGRRLLALKRTDIDLLDYEDGRGRGLATADNRTSEINLSWNYDELTKLVGQETIDLAPFFTPNEIDDITLTAELPSLEHLERQYGEAEEVPEEQTWPGIIMKVSPELRDRFYACLQAMPGETDGEKLSALLDRIDLSDEEE